MKHFIVMFLLFFINNCTTGSNLITNDKIYTGMSKAALCDVLLYKSSFDEDACLSKVNFKYNPLTKKEIIWGENRKIYYIIKDKNKSTESGILESWTNSYSVALKRIKPKKEKIISKDIEIIGAGS